MNTEELAECGAELKRRGHNCCQAVVAALSGETQLTEEQLLQISSGFGGGMGTTEATCGSLTGAAMIAGLKLNGQGTMRYSRQLVERFKSLSGAITCKTLKGLDGAGIFCPCDECVRNAIRAYCGVMYGET